MASPPANTRPLRLHLHGPAGVADATGLRLPLRGRAAALLALVALEPGISRQRAAALLWPEADQPRNNLRQQLARFRSALGQPLIDGTETLTLATHVVLAEAPAGAELLAGEDYGDDELAAWLARRRSADRQVRREPLLAALDAAEAAGSLDEALAHARNLGALADDADEAAQARLMRLHYLRGETDLGLAVFRQLGAALARNGQAPSATTRALADALARGHGKGTLSYTAPALPVTLQRPPQLAGRDAERAAAAQAWAAGLAVLVEGEAGLGKSRLLAELCRGSQGLLAAAGRPGDRGTPYATLQRLLQPLQAPADRVRADAVAALLAAHGVQTLVLDDLHFADEATLELLAGLAAGDDSGVQRWLFAQRPAEVPPAAVALRDGLLEQRRLAVLRLGPLDAAAAAQLVDGLGIAGLEGARVAEPLVRHTGGNPLFLLETLKQGLVDGSLARGELPRPGSVGALIERRLQRLGERALTLARVAAVAGVDFGIELAEAAIGVRAVELAGAWDELQTAQVLRDEAFAHDLVADAVLRGIPAVVARRMHAQCAEWLAQRQGEPARVAWHWWHGGDPARAAAAFESAAGRAASAGRRREEAELYQHAAEAWTLAGDAERAFEARASRVDALTRADFGPLALDEARALQAAAADDVQRLRAARTEIDLLANRGQAEEVVPRARQALALAQRLNLPGEQLAVSGPLAGCLTLLGRADEARDALAALRPWIEQQAEPLQRQVWLGYMATALVDLGQLAESARLRRQQLDIALTLDIKPVAVVAYNHLGVVEGTRGHPRLAIEACRQAVALCEQMPGDVTRSSLARLTLARQLVDAACFAEALAILEPVLAHFASAGSRFWAEQAAMALAALWIRLGQAGRAQPLLQRDAAGLAQRQVAQRRLLALELAGTLEQPLPEALADEACAALPGELGAALATRTAALRAREPARAFDEATVLTRELRRHERQGAEAAAWMWRARAATALGRHDAGAESAQRLADLLAQDVAPEGMYRGEAYRQVWQTWAAAGHEAEAREALHRAVAWVQQQALPNVPPPFVDGFLYRQPANRLLFAAVGRAA